MIKIIEKYYKAWETNDLELLSEVLHPALFGVRTYTEEKLFSIQEVFDYFPKNKIETVEILSHTMEKNIVKLELLINKVPVQARIIINNNEIYKVYEIVKTNKRRIKCVCAYDGSSYSGYQKQLNASSIQGAIEEALHKIFKSEIAIHSSGRTDKGVHAINQVFHFDIESTINAENIKKVLNAYLPDAIHIKASEEVDLTFHSRYDVLEKEYMYKINTNEYDPIQRNYEWALPNFDALKFNEQLQQIVGTKDFQSFTKTTDNSTVRTIIKRLVAKKIIAKHENKTDRHYYYTPVMTKKELEKSIVHKIFGDLLSKFEYSTINYLAEELSDNEEEIDKIKEKIYLYYTEKC